MASSSARYRINAVAESTGLSTASLRAWERRYGIPSPTRGETGYRLYTEADIEQVKRMVELGDQGVAPSEAARIVRAESVQAAAIPVDEPPAVDSDAYDAMAARLLAAAEAMDQETLESELYSAMGMGSAWTVYARIIAPVLVEIGAGWAHGRISVGHEHLASQALGTALRSLVRLLQRPDARRIIVLACVAEEQHDLPLYGVAVLAATLGWQPRIVGPRTPAGALAKVLEQTRPMFIGLSVTVPLKADEPTAFFAAYGEACGDIPWVLGGAAAAPYRAAVEAAGGRIFAGGTDELRAMFEAP